MTQREYDEIRDWSTQQRAVWQVAKHVMGEHSPITHMLEQRFIAARQRADAAVAQWLKEHP